MKRFKLLITIQCLLFLIPLNIYVIGDWLATGIQWTLFRFQESIMGNSLILLNRDFNYILTGVLTGRSALPIALWIIGAVFLIISLFLSIFAWNNDKPMILKKSAFFTIFGGFLFLLAMIVQYGPLLHGEKGFSIPFGVPLVIITGLWMYFGFDEGKKEKNNLSGKSVKLIQ
jgi:hypothetical protein